jgi:hypothetical protein
MRAGFRQGLGESGADEFVATFHDAVLNTRTAGIRLSSKALQLLN